MVPQGSVAKACMSKCTRRDEFLLNWPVFEKHIHLTVLFRAVQMLLIYNIKPFECFLRFRLKNHLVNFGYGEWQISYPPTPFFFCTNRSTLINCILLYFNYLYAATVCKSRNRYSCFQGSGVEMTFRNHFDTVSNEFVPQSSVKMFYFLEIILT